MNTSKKKNKKEKERKSLNWDGLCKNNNNHESIDEIEKEKIIIININNFSSFLLNILNEFKSAKNQKMKRFLRI